VLLWLLRQKKRIENYRFELLIRFTAARKKQANYEVWVANKVSEFGTLQDPDHRVGVVNAVYQKYFGRMASDQEVQDGHYWLPRMGEAEYDAYVSTKFYDFATLVFHKAWRMCQGCTYLYVREPTDYKWNFVSQRLRNGQDPSVVQSMYEEYIKLKIRSYFTVVLNRTLPDSFVEDKGVFGKLVVLSPEDLMGAMLQPYVAEVNNLVGVDISTQPLIASEKELADFAKLGYDEYKGRKLAPVMTAVLSILQ